MVEFQQKTEILINEFYKLKEEVNSLLEKENVGKFSYLQYYLYFNYCPLFSFAESIIILCKNGKFNSANVLLRSLIEAHINIVYHQLNNSNHKLATSAKAMFDQRIKILRELKDLIRKYKNLESTDSTNLFSKAYLDKAEEFTQRDRQAIMRGNNLHEKDKDLDLKSKAIKCDDEFNKKIEKGHFERMYALQYRYLSPYSHFDLEGIQSFVEKNGSGVYSFHEGSGGDVLIIEAIDICLAFSKDLFEEGVIKGKISQIDNIDKLLKE